MSSSRTDSDDAFSTLPAADEGRPARSAALGECARTALVVLAFELRRLRLLKLPPGLLAFETRRTRSSVGPAESRAARLDCASGGVSAPRGEFASDLGSEPGGKILGGDERTASLLNGAEPRSIDSAEMGLMGFMKSGEDALYSSVTCMCADTCTGATSSFGWTSSSAERGVARPEEPCGLRGECEMEGRRDPRPESLSMRGLPFGVGPALEGRDAVGCAVRSAASAGTPAGMLLRSMERERNRGGGVVDPTGIAAGGTGPVFA